MGTKMNVLKLYLLLVQRHKLGTLEQKLPTTSAKSFHDLTLDGLNGHVIRGFFLIDFPPWVSTSGGFAGAWRRVTSNSAVSSHPQTFESSTVFRMVGIWRSSGEENWTPERLLGLRFRPKRRMHHP